jgi:glycosyltransferase involved in cell wall biosynthesis
MVRASVIICTHNPRPHYLDRVLTGLRNQDVSPEQWELLLVDNASEPTVQSRWDIAWHPNGRHVREDELGLAAARRRGIAEAISDLLVFVDDDNVLANDYLSQALRISQEWPVLGTWGSGGIVPEFEEEPEDYIRPYVRYLALRNVRQAFWSNVMTCKAATPQGAGMCVRARVAKAYRDPLVNETIKLSGRKGTALVGHEDFEIAYTGCRLGFGMGIFPELRMTHLIPKERVSEEYLLRLAEANQISGGLLDYKWLGESPPDPLSVRGILGMVKNVVLTGGFHRKHHLALMRGRIKAKRRLANYNH